jgi:hypothetical protein
MRCRILGALMMSRGSTASPEDHEELRQERLSKFGRILAIVGLVYTAVHFTFSVWLHEPLLSLEVLPELIATAAFTSLWLILRGKKRSPAVVRAIEIATLVTGTGHSRRWRW